MNKKDIRIIFMGTSEFAVPIFEKLYQNYDIKLVVTVPDKPAGRNLQLTASPVKIRAEQKNLAISQPKTLKDNHEFISQLQQIKPDLIIVAAYGKILPAEIINLPEHGCLNIHPSLLPKNRGATPIQSVLLKGKSKTGTSIILMDLGMDTGDILAQEEIKITDEDDYLSLSLKLSQISADLLDETIIPYIKNEITLQIQDDDNSSYCQKIEKTDARINWAMSARAIKNKIRAFTGNIGTYTMFNDKRLNIIKAQVCPDPCLNLLEIEMPLGKVFKCDLHTQNYICVKTGQGAILPQVVKIEGKKAMAINEFINGYQNFNNAILR